MVVLSKIVQKGVHKWCFQLFKCHRRGFTITIGVWKTKYAVVTNQALYSSIHKSKCYGYITTFAEATHGDGMNAQHGEKCKEGDIVDMILDLERLEIRYSVNDKDLGVAFKEIEQTEYRAAVICFMTIMR